MDSTKEKNYVTNTFEPQIDEHVELMRHLHIENQIFLK